MAGGDRGDFRRRLQRLIDKKEAGVMEEEQILKLKRDLRTLMDRQEHRWMMVKAKLAGAALPPP